MKYLITYKMDGVTEYLTFNGCYYTFSSKFEAQQALAAEKEANPEIKGWRIVRRYVA